MRLLSFDALPDNYKQGVQHTGAGRYELFRSDVEQFMAGKKGDVTKLLQFDEWDFPYSDIRITRFRSPPNLTALNRAGKMGVIGTDDRGRDIYIEAKLSPLSLSQADLPIGCRDIIL